MSKEILCKLIYKIQISLEKQEAIQLNGKVLKDKNNDLSFLDECIDKVGIYLFFCSHKNNPVYIGVGGIKKKQDLKTRISQELRWYDTDNNKGDTGAVLSINMNKSKVEFYKELQNMKLKFCAFNEKNTRNQDLAIRLEHLLIGIYNPKYNKRAKK